MGVLRIAKMLVLDLVVIIVTILVQVDALEDV